MCGIAAILNLNNQHTPVSRTIIERMRDRLTHRGPDDAGLYEGPLGSIAHRRLSVIDPTPAGHQPMLSPDRRYILAYNGELYNDHDLRSQLATLGVRFTSSCDTETLLHALITWREDAIDKLRGMFAFVFLDTQTQTMIMARDPMGIKPLYHTVIDTHNGQQLLVASEITALLEHPQVIKRPDPITMSAYLSSIRTTLADRTLYEGISTLTPGQWITVPLDNPSQTRSINWWDSPHTVPTQGVKQTIEDSVHRHLRTDVPMCALLSGGLDSAITTLIAKKSLGQLNTFCAGAKVEGFGDDFKYASMLAQQLGTNHTEVEITQDGFIERWQWMISKLAIPLSTPNEVAIYEVSAALSNAGHVVAISGEGADELFGGYAPIMKQASAHVRGLNTPNGTQEDTQGGLFHLRSNAWISEELKPAVLKDSWFYAANADQDLRDYYQQSFDELREQCPKDSPLQAHLRFQRRMNLPNLLARLDTSTMLASVEGRTPYADIEVAICAEVLSMNQKYIDGDEPQTKIALRSAYANQLPSEIVNRPKASFPLPFQHWMEGALCDRLSGSPFAREVFTDEAIGLVCAQPTKYWHMAWPMMNLMLWGDTVFAGRTTNEIACSTKYSSSTT